MEQEHTHRTASYCRNASGDAPFCKTARANSKASSIARLVPCMETMQFLYGRFYIVFFSGSLYQLLLQLPQKCFEYEGPGAKVPESSAIIYCMPSLGLKHLPHGGRSEVCSIAKQADTATTILLAVFSFAEEQRMLCDRLQWGCPQQLPNMLRPPTLSSFQRRQTSAPRPWVLDQGDQVLMMDTPITHPPYRIYAALSLSARRNGFLSRPGNCYQSPPLKCNPTGVGYQARYQSYDHHQRSSAQHCGPFQAPLRRRFLIAESDVALVAKRSKVLFPPWHCHIPCQPPIRQGMRHDAISLIGPRIIPQQARTNWPALWDCPALYVAVNLMSWLTKPGPCIQAAT